MNSDNIVREVARFSNGFHQLVTELMTELYAQEELVKKLGEKVDILMMAGVKGYNATDLGNMVSEIQQEGLLDDYIDQRITDHPEVVSEDTIRELARDEAEEMLRNTSFTVTVD
jgi:hypothetical protein